MKSHFTVEPPLLNSANPWCTSLGQLQELYDCPHTGAVTTRTSLLAGFRHEESIHQFTFFDPSSHDAAPANPTSPGPLRTGSLNTLGYSPLPLSSYLDFVQEISDKLSNVSPPESSKPKPFIISVTGTVDEVIECYNLIHALQDKVRMQLAMEINLSCPNIADKPPPAYDFATLLSYLKALKSTLAYKLRNESNKSNRTNVLVPVGIKTPPYTYHNQYKGMIDALLGSAQLSETPDLGCPVSFITATNTLGSSLLLTPNVEIDSSTTPSTSGPEFHHTLNSEKGVGIGIGGLAGAPLHPLALGNVYTIRQMLSQHKELEDIQTIGVGGVEDVEGYRRMRAVGASAVAVGTALGRMGVKVFDEIGKGLQY